MILDVLQVVALLSTAAFGVIGLVKPESITGFTGLNPNGARGLSELRGIFGGLFIGLGLAPLLLGTAEAYQVIGIGYLVLAAARSFSVIYDGCYDRSNLISVVTEIAFGIVLVLG